MNQRFQWHLTPRRYRTLLNGLHFAWRGHDNAWPPIASAVHDGTSYKTLGPAGWDVGYIMSDATPARLYFPYHELNRPSTAITVATVMTPINSTDVQAMVVCLANDNYRLSWGMQDAGEFYSGRDIRFWVCASVASQIATAIDGGQSLTIGTPYLLVGFWGPQTGNYVGLSIWNLNTGVLVGAGISSSTQAGPISTDATGDPLKLQIGGDRWNEVLVSGDNWIGMGAVWNRVLAEEELAVLAEDPYSWLESTRRVPIMSPLITEEEVAAIYEQYGYRWRLDDGDETGATWYDEENLHTFAPNSSTERRRLRVGIGTSGATGLQTVRLQLRKKGEASWQDVKVSK